MLTAFVPSHEPLPQGAYILFQTLFFFSTVIGGNLMSATSILAFSSSKLSTIAVLIDPARMAEADAVLMMMYGSLSALVGAYFGFSGAGKK